MSRSTWFRVAVLLCVAVFTMAPDCNGGVDLGGHARCEIRDTTQGTCRATVNGEAKEIAGVSGSYCRWIREQYDSGATWTEVAASMWGHCYVQTQGDARVQYKDIGLCRDMCSWQPGSTSGSSAVVHATVSRITVSAPLVFTWSTAGALPGTCVRMKEEADPHTWTDNYLCTNFDIGLRWSNSGPIDGMNCISIKEGCEPPHHTWTDNYLCLPPDGPKVDLQWSMAGPVAGKACVNVNEPSDPHCWADNFLCY